MSACILHLSGRCNCVGIYIQYLLNSKLNVAQGLSGPFGGKTKKFHTVFIHIFLHTATKFPNS